MDTNYPVCNDMMSKFKESFSLKSFFSKSYQSSLICNSKTFRLDVNLVEGAVLTSSKSFLRSNLISNSLKDVPIKSEAAIWHDRNFDYSEGKNEFAETRNSINKFIKIERTEEISNTECSQSSFSGDSQRSSAENSQKYFTGDSRISFIGNLQRSLTGDSQRSLTGDSQSSLTSDWQRSVTGDSQRSATGDTKIALKVTAKHLHQAKSHNSSNEVQTKAEQKCSEFKSLRCDVCMKYFSSARNVKRHSVLHSLERHPCETCGKVFQTKENLKRHCRAMHEVKVKSIKCFKCFKAYSRRTSLNLHLKKHPDHVIICPSIVPQHPPLFDLQSNQND